MSSEKVFKTKSGFCHILPDEIVLTIDGVVGNISKVLVGKSITRILIIYGCIALWLFYSAYKYFMAGHNLASIAPILIGAYLANGIVSSLNNSTTPVIKRETIQDVILKNGIPGITRPRFEILFEDQNGKLKKRIIMLPGSLSNGQDEIQKAIELMQAEGLLKS